VLLKHDCSVIECSRGASAFTNGTA